MTTRQIQLGSLPQFIGFWLFIGCCWGGLASHSAWGQTEDQLEVARNQLVDVAVMGAGVKDPRVIQSLRQTRRHEFLPRNLRRVAYYDISLPIGDNQTISSPFIVAYMTESLDPQPSDKVLEIGTGSGYQAAILSPLVSEVYTIEIKPALGRRAERTLKRLDYENVHVKIGDGFKGWPEHAPFDKIIVTCSPEKVPQPLVEQLKEGGKMVIPVGERYQQTLVLMKKVDGKLESDSLRPTLFVPMTGRAEEQREVLPDPANPQLVNGDFEVGVDEDGFVKGWYYQRLLSWETDQLAPGGEHFVRFRNDEPGRPAHLLQALPIDGREVRRIRLRAHVRSESVVSGLGNLEKPFVAIAFYDENRKDLGGANLGPFVGSRDWQPVERVVNVPRQAREAILRIGMFGATGQMDFDRLAIERLNEQ